MKRFMAVRCQGGEWQVLDLKGEEGRVLCICTGFKAPLNAEYICDALEAYHSQLISKFLQQE